MQHRIHPVEGPIQTEVTIPGSRYITHLAITLAALADGVSELHGLRFDDETKAHLKVLREAGIVVQPDEKTLSCIIAGGNGKFPKAQTHLLCDLEADLAQYLIAVCASSPGVHYLDATTALREQSFAPILDILNRQGMQFIPNDATCMPFTIIGADSLGGGEIAFAADHPVTLACALLLVAPYARSAANFIFHETTTQEYIDITCAMMAEFGVLTRRMHQGQLMVPVPQKYHARDYSVEADHTLAVYFLAAAAVTGGEITIHSLRRSLSRQVEVKCLSLMEKMGCKISESKYALTLTGPEVLQGIEVSLREFSEVFLIMTAMAPFANAPTRIAHVGKPGSAETSLLKTVGRILESIKIKVETGDDWIKIFPGTPEGCTIDAQDDHRVAMAFSLVGLKVPGVIIENAYSVGNVFPEFFERLNGLTEKAEVEA